MCLMVDYIGVTTGVARRPSDSFACDAAHLGDMGSCGVCGVAVPCCFILFALASEWPTWALAGEPD